MKISFQIEYRTQWGEEVRIDLLALTATGKETRKTQSYGTFPPTSY